MNRPTVEMQDISLSRTPILYRNVDDGNLSTTSRNSESKVMNSFNSITSKLKKCESNGKKVTCHSMYSLFYTCKRGLLNWFCKFVLQG